MSERQTRTLENQELIQELTESVEKYAETCRETVQGERAIQHAMRGLVRHVFQLPEEGNDIENWDPEKAELMACQLDLVASQHETQAKRIRTQVAALRRMNTAIIAVRKEAFSEDDRSAEG